MSEIIYISSYSIEAETQRMQHNFIPVIKEAVGDVPVDITIGKSDNNVYINGTPIGDYRRISNITADGNWIRFDYDNKKYRWVGIADEFISAMFNRPLGNVDWVIECRKGKAGTKWIVDNINAGGHK